MRALSVVATLGLLLAFGSASAAGPLQDRIIGAVPATSGQVLSQFGNVKPRGAMSGVLRQVLPKVGRYVKWGGVVSIGGDLVLDALKWFYEEAKSSTNTPLDTWWRQTDMPPFPELGNISQMNNNFWNEIYNISSPFEAYFTVQGAGTGYTWKVSCAGNIYQDHKPNTWPSQASVQAAYNVFRDIAAGCPASSPFSAWNTQHGGGMPEALTNVVQSYLNAHPQYIYPKIDLDPPPNANQKIDDIENMTIDTDDDGVADGYEIRRGPNGSSPQPDGGNRPHPEDGPPSDPNDPSDKPVDTNKDGKPDYLDGDDDGDTAPDDTETPEAQKDKDKTPDKYKDTDGDGINDDLDTDDDNDGFTDAEELEAGTDPKDPVDKPEEEEEEDPKCSPGQKLGSDGVTCEEDKDPPKCKEGQKLNADTGKCEEDQEPDGPIEDNCGDLSLSRAKAHLGHFMRDVVFPCGEIKDLIKPITDTLETKFPFSIAVDLNDWFVAPGDSSSASALPTMLGIIPLDWGWLTPLWAIIKTLAGVAMWAWFIYWVIDRFAPRTQI